MDTNFAKFGKNCIELLSKGYKVDSDLKIKLNLYLYLKLRLTKDFYSELSRQTGIKKSWIIDIYDAKNIEPKLKIKRGEYGEKIEEKITVSITKETAEIHRGKIVDKNTNTFK